MSQSKMTADKADKPAKAQLSPAEHRVLQPILAQEPHYENISLKDLQIDYTYQDRPRDTLVRQIAEYFSPAMLGTLIVSKRPNGSLFVCDGATRKLGLELRGEGDRVVRCQVFNTDGVKQEALLFKFYNGARKAVPLANRLTAEGVGGVDGGFLKTIKSIGFTLTGNSKKALKGAGFVKKAYEIDDESMQKALFALKESWGEKHGRLDGVAVLGVTMIYSKVRNCDMQVRRWLKGHGPEELSEITHIVYGGGKQLKKTLKLRPNQLPWFIAKAIGLDINRRARDKKLNLAQLDAMQEVWEQIQAHPA